MRPSLKIVDEAHMFESDITIEAPLGVANAKSILEVTMLGMANDTEVIIKAEGDDEQEAVDAISKILQGYFEESLVEDKK